MTRIPMSIVRAIVRRRMRGIKKVSIVVPEIFFAYIVRDMWSKYRDPEVVNRELYRMGAWVGPQALYRLADPASLERLFPADGNLEGVANYMELMAAIAFEVYCAVKPTVTVQIVEKDEKVVYGVLEMPEGEDSFFTEIDAPEGVNPLFFVAGAYDTATQAAFAAMERAKGFYGFWRPKGERAMAGFYIPPRAEFEKALKTIEEVEPKFFKTITLKLTVDVLINYAGYPPPPNV